MLADSSIVQVRRNKLHREFSGGGEKAHMWTVPAQEMLLCNLPGPGGPGGSGGAEPKPSEQRELPSAVGTPEDRSVAHDANQKPAWRGEDEKT